MWKQENISPEENNSIKKQLVFLESEEDAIYARKLTIKVLSSASNVNCLCANIISKQSATVSVRIKYFNCFLIFMRNFVAPVN